MTELRYITHDEMWDPVPFNLLVNAVKELQEIVARLEADREWAEWLAGLQ